MVKEGSKRAEKFIAKYDPDVMLLRWKALRDFSMEKFWIPSWEHYVLDQQIQNLSKEYELEYGKIARFHDKLKKLIYKWDMLTEDQKQTYKEDWIAEGLPEELFDKIPNILVETKTFFYRCVFPYSYLFYGIDITPTPEPKVFPKEEDYVLDPQAPQEKEILDIPTHALNKGFLDTLICAHNVVSALAPIFPPLTLGYISWELFPELLRDLSYHTPYNFEPLLQSEVEMYLVGFPYGWGYRKSHAISGASGAGANYQMKIVVHYGSGTDSGENVYLNSHSREDFGDIRFTDDDGLTLLDYWLESKVNGDYAIFWVEVKDDLSNNQSIYIYYGKSDETTTSNGENTFVFFDDASSNKLSSYTLRNLYNAPMNASLSYDSVNKRYVVTFSAQDAVGIEISGVSGASFEVWMRGMVTVDSLPNSNQQFGVLSRYSAAYCWWHRKVYAGASSIKLIDIIKEPTPPNINATQIAVKNEINYIQRLVWYQVKGHAFGTVYWVWCEHENLSVSGSSNDASGTWGVFMGNWNYPYFPSIYFKDVVVRKYVSPEPSHGSWGSEEPL